MLKRIILITLIPIVCLQQQINFSNEIEELDFLEEKISLVEQKIDSLSSKKEMESFLLENKFFDNGQNIILKTKTDPSINFVSFFNGVTSH